MNLLRKKFKQEKGFRTIVLILTLISVLIGYGVYFYLQMRSFPWWLWIMIADCPIAATFFLIHEATNEKSKFFHALSFSSLVAFGFIGLVVFFFHKPVYYTQLLTYAMLVGHIGMLFLSAILFTSDKLKPIHFIPTYLWFVLNLLSDKFLGTFSYIFEQVTLSTHHSFVFVIVVGLIAPMFLLYKVKD